MEQPLLACLLAKPPAPAPAPALALLQKPSLINSVLPVVLIFLLGMFVFCIGERELASRLEVIVALFLALTGVPVPAAAAVVVLVVCVCARVPEAGAGGQAGLHTRGR